MFQRFKSFFAKKSVEDRVRNRFRSEIKKRKIFRKKLAKKLGFCPELLHIILEEPEYDRLYVLRWIAEEIGFEMSDLLKEWKDEHISSKNE